MKKSMEMGCNRTVSDNSTGESQKEQLSSKGEIVLTQTQKSTL